MQSRERPPAPVPPLPPLSALDPRKLRLLRSEQHAELKNTLMMTTLMASEWYLRYREQLRVYREENGAMPQYPSERVERVESLVSQLIRVSVDPEYSRRFPKRSAPSAPRLEEDEAGADPYTQPVVTITPDGRQKLTDLVEGDTLVSLFTEACEMAKKHEMDYQFIFFALHGGNIYKQPTDVRDYDVVQESSVAYHTSRDDYEMHGTITKMPLPQMMATDAVVCHVCKRDEMVAVVASLPEYDYEEVFTVF